MTALTLPSTHRVQHQSLLSGKFPTPRPCVASDGWREMEGRRGGSERTFTAGMCALVYVGTVGSAIGTYRRVSVVRCCRSYLLDCSGVRDKLTTYKSSEAIYVLEACVWL